MADRVICLNTKKMNPITESEIEEAALEILSELDYGILHGPDIAPDGPTPERHGYSDVILIDRLRNTINSFNPHIPQEAREEALKKTSELKVQTLS